ncbi:hypothetical protein J4476_04760 [Candidatus Woesearchaeota archaeon]|nr:MAG: hypothetical protein QT09_C0007G0091 [archaeon GW2011_AR18]MBS3161975.1 hypothetical protein [Candidatus Woesearchaeota archaeon]HIH25595.1 hypothetical protein [Nanoarchaeota archaeon]
MKIGVIILLLFIVLSVISGCSNTYNTGASIKDKNEVTQSDCGNVQICVGDNCKHEANDDCDIEN